MNPAVKIVLGTASLAGVTGGGILVKKYITPSDGIRTTLISEQLKTDGYVLLDENGDWNATYNKYKETSFNYPRFSLNSQELKDIKSECAKVLNSPNNNSDYKKARKWCVKPMSVKELIASKKLNLLDVKDTGSENQAEYQSLINEYKKSGKGEKAINGLTLNEDSNNWSLLRAQCKTLSEKDFWNADYDSAIYKVELWCVREAINKS
ncbi:hypothetical protein MHC_01830 [Mycoplasma haemocanis str. Illinois]|uniref:Uncharacterized protein n=1 Tax=Mycoplasma haemocanis (strain Illinois) TaxID=1111676 RepID=H6N6G0_MYCHN|nr:hypothetical protein [Mycoplasma haemocanis]AEW45232.1 hypothetical protein MHC_01830 [Mycoplasma haemocanis str. Illinois]